LQEALHANLKEKNKKIKENWRWK